MSQKDRRENVEGFAITKREQQKLYARANTDKVRGKFKVRTRRRATTTSSEATSSRTKLILTNTHTPCADFVFAVGFKDEGA